MKLRIKRSDSGMLMGLGSWNGLDFVIGEIYPGSNRLGDEIVKRVNAYDELIGGTNEVYCIMRKGGLWQICKSLFIAETMRMKWEASDPDGEYTIELWGVISDEFAEID